MKKYLGVKIVEAEPMSYFDYITLSEKGKGIVGQQFDNQDGYKVIYEDGYVSWSPKDVFEKAYKELQEQDLGLSIVFLNTVSGNWRYSFEGENIGLNPMKLTFGQAIEALKQGKKVARAGWNGKGMWLMLVPNELAESVSFQYEALSPLPWIGMKTADEKLIPWSASHTDMLAEDWQIVE